MSLHIDHLSHSAIQQFVSCPTSWASRYALGLRSVKGDAANFGTHFESLVAYHMGFKEALTEYHDEDNRKIKCTEAEYRSKFVTPDMERGADLYNRQKWAWKAADEYQRFVELTPAKWGTYAGEYGADEDLAIRLIGFIDFTRKTAESKSLPEPLRPSEVLDIKTIYGDIWKPEWAQQGVLYCLAIGSTRFTVHRYVHGLPHKLSAVTVNLDTPNGKTLVKQTMNTVAHYVRQIKAISDDPGLLEQLPRKAGKHCDWCPLVKECVSGSPFESFGNKQWAKTEEGITATELDTFDGLMGGLV